MNRDYPMQTTVDGEDAPILGSVLTFPEEREGEPKIDHFPKQTTVGGEEKSDFEDYCFDIIIMMLAFIAAFIVYSDFVAWGM